MPVLILLGLMFTSLLFFGILGALADWLVPLYDEWREAKCKDSQNQKRSA